MKGITTIVAMLIVLMMVVPASAIQISGYVYASSDSGSATVSGNVLVGDVNIVTSASASGDDPVAWTDVVVNYDTSFTADIDMFAIAGDYDLEQLYNGAVTTVDLTITGDELAADISADATDSYYESADVTGSVEVTGSTIDGTIEATAVDDGNYLDATASVTIPVNEVNELPVNGLDVTVDSSSWSEDGFAFAQVIVTFLTSL